MRQSRRDAVLGGAVVVQIFMQSRRYSVLHGSLYRVGRKPGAQAFAETGGVAAILPRRLAYLRNSGAGRCASQRALPDGGMLPARAIGMTLPCGALRDSGGQQAGIGLAAEAGANVVREFVPHRNHHPRKKK